jgi:CNT family concentrative nucleoside transporter
MGALGVLLVAFLLWDDRGRFGSPWAWGGAVVGASLGLGFVLTLAPAPVLGWASIGLIAVLAASLKVGPLKPVRRHVGALLVVAGAAYLVSARIYGEQIFGSFSDGVASFLALSDHGARFLFGNLADPSFYFPGDGAAWPGFGFQFAFKVLPTIIFFGGLMGVLYYLGVIQAVIVGITRFMRWTIGTSGSETLSCSANIFVGQTEAPLLIKPFLAGMTKSELLTIMLGGFATISGGVMAGYISLGIPAGHLVAASVMSAPAALVVAKIIFPELEESETRGAVRMPEINVGDNAIEAASRGITDGMRLAVNVGAMLIGFIALLAVVDLLLNWLDRLIDGQLLGGAYAAYGGGGGLSPAEGEYAGVFPGSLRTAFGTLLRPIAFLMGVPWADSDEVGNLLGIKLSLNEFVAYTTLGGYIHDHAVSQRSVTIATYALCGFANFSSIGIQIGGISALAPSRQSDLAKVGLRAMLGGAIASFMTATIAGMLIT